MGKILAALGFFSVFILGGLVLIFTPPDKLCLFYIDQAGCREYFREKVLYGNVKLTEKAYFASSRRFETQKRLEWLAAEGKQIQIGKSLPNDLIQSNPADITILIHGFRGTDDTVASYFEEFAPLLNSRGPDHPVVIYDWPSVARAYLSLSPFELDMIKDTMNPKRRNQGSANGSTMGPNSYERQDHSELEYMFQWESAQYQRDQGNARSIGADGFAMLLSDLAAQFPKARINVVSHSMGCYVVEQALRKQANVATALTNVIWLAPDVAANALDDKAIRDAVAKIGKLTVYYSRDDEALKWPSRIENGGKRLGAVGLVGAAPGNVRIHDETNSINAVLTSVPKKDQSVHSAFLRTDTGVPDAVLKLLATAEGASN